LHCQHRSAQSTTPPRRRLDQKFGAATSERARSASGGRRAVSAPEGAGAKTVVAASRRSGLEVIESKLRVPDAAAATVPRTALVNRLRAAGAFPIVLVVAPAGYGKTTLLAQWAARDVRPFAWISLDERDNDSHILLRNVAAAIDRIAPLPDAVVEAVRDPEGSVWTTALPRLTGHLASQTSSCVVVFDNADALDSRESADVVCALIENIPGGSMIALAGRATPNVPVAALRVGTPLLEIGPYELALSRREAELLLRSCAVELREDRLLELLEQTEGWAAGIYLAALAVREGERDEGMSFEPAEFAGDDRYLADYFRSEYLSRMTPGLLRFLRRTSVLERMCGPLCDALLLSTGSALQLEEIEKANLFVVPLDRDRMWFRYHPLFRDLLRRELERYEPHMVRTLNERAAEWYEAHGDWESAFEHARAADDSNSAARILASIAFDVRDHGRVAAVEGWLEYFEDDRRLDDHPAVAILGSNVHALLGRPDEADRWLRAAERAAVPGRKGVVSTRSWIAAMRAAMCADGPERMQDDAATALAKLQKDDRWRPSALLSRGAAAMLLGQVDQAESIMLETADESRRLGCTETRAVAIAERSLLAAARDDHREADGLALEAYDLVETAELGDYPTSSLSVAVSGRALLRQGQWDKARQRLTVAERLTARLTYAIPWLAVQVRLELGHGYVALRDREGACRVLEEMREILLTRPDLGKLVAAFRLFEETIAAMPDETGSAGLTPAELRLLPLLTTHLSFREIGERLYVSRNTVKTQAISVYRKLGVSSRSEAIACAAKLGLVERGAASEGASKTGADVRLTAS
jgi:LuxR family maltose regulon positive regulatory protein